MTIGCVGNLKIKVKNYENIKLFHPLHPNDDEAKFENFICALDSGNQLKTLTEFNVDPEQIQR